MFNPYSYSEEKELGGYSFVTDCGIKFRFGFKRDTDLFGYEISGYTLLTLQFDKITFEKIENPLRVSNTLCQAISDIISNDPNEIIWYICSLKGFKDGVEDNGIHAKIRQRIFTQWFHKHKTVFPEINFYTFGTKDPPPLTPEEEEELKKSKLQRPEPVHMGFVYHDNFDKFEEIKDILEYLSADQLSTDKDVYAMEFDSIPKL